MSVLQYAATWFTILLTDGFAVMSMSHIGQSEIYRPFQLMMPCLPLMEYKLKVFMALHISFQSSFSCVILLDV